MKSHIWKPLYVVIGIVVAFLVVRSLYVPSDFGTGERGFRYSYHRKSNEDEWKAMKIKFKTSEYCKDCHSENYAGHMKSRHAVVECENCHGLAIEHPDNPPKLAIDKSRNLCLRCHSKLPYPTSGRALIRGIDPEKHNPDIECVMCHNPHKPGEGLK
jgi:predicted CXXCH cytochrome family protein